MKRSLICLAAAVAALASTACTAPASEVERVVEAQGMTNVHTTGHRFFGCGRDDATQTGFTATGANGHPVSGVVCGGLGPFSKGYTVRLD